MSRYHSYLNTSQRILTAFKGEMPFSNYLKIFFSKEKKYGSRDRKQIANICYSYFRVGLGFDKNISADTLLAACFLTTRNASPIISELMPAWEAHLNKPLPEKLAFLPVSFNLQAVFPYTGELNESINAAAFLLSFFSQPDLFIRIRPSYKKTVSEKIISSGFEHEFLHDGQAVRFPAGTKIESFLQVDKEVVIQDYQSQQVLNYLEKNKDEFPQQPAVWDCCAASGGKSILVTDRLQGKLNLTVSDIREGILANLQQRFLRAGINSYRSFAADVGDHEKQATSKYDIIICDAPCTGSGTWSRTPEQLYFFKPETIGSYVELQQKITANTVTQLKEGGLFFYITCSVFKKENDDPVAQLLQYKNLRLVEKKYLYGYAGNSDSMFVAVFKKEQAPTNTANEH